MASIPSRAQLDEIVCEAISLALAVELSQVAPDKYLVDDLDAESIDFLDITFRIEQRLPVVIPRDDLIEQADEAFGEGIAIDTNRELTPFGAYLVQQRLAGIDPNSVKPGMKADRIAALWTVQSWVELSERLLSTIPETCTCGGERTFRADDSDALEAVCGTCGTTLSGVPGDELNRRWFDSIKDDSDVAALIAASRPSDADPAR